MRVGRVCVFPCNGIRRREACVARLSGYYVDEELLPGKILILCLPALLRGVEEDVLMVEKNPTLVIEGCEERCGSHALWLFGILPAAMVYIPEIAKEAALTPGSSRQTLDETGRELSLAVARRAAQVAEGMLTDKEYSFARQPLRREGVALCSPMADVAGALGYLRVGVGVYRPAAMPSFKISSKLKAKSSKEKGYELRATGYGLRFDKGETSHGVEKVCVYPCGGIGLIVSCVTRLAAYILEEERFSSSERVGILSPPSLLRGLEEDRRLVEECPTLVIDGCAHQCGSNLLRLLEICPAARIYLPEVMLETGLQPGRTRKELEESGKQLAREAARLAAAIVEEILSDPSYVFARQAIRPETQTLFDYSVDVEKEMGYIQVAQGVYRPAKMPPFRWPSAALPSSP